MIRDLDRTLEQLLKRELPAGVVVPTISFLAPDNQFPPSGVSVPAVDLFLYDVRENTDLRSTEWRVERSSNGTATRRPPLVRVDCSYMITAWPSTSSNDPAQDEHLLLSQVMRTLLAYSTLPGAVLQGDLRGQEPPLPASSLQPGRLQSLGEFWQALGGKPKAALHLTVTIGVEPGLPVETGPPVTDKRLRFSSGTGESS
jgi:hypothetical protein